MIIFVSLAVVGLFFLLASAFFGHDVDADHDVGAGHFGFLSVRVLAVFLTAFGAVGAIARWYEQSTLAASTWGLVAAIPLCAVYALAMRALRSQQASSLIEDGDLVGLLGRVTVPLSAEGLGEVSCTCKAQTTRRMARSRSHVPIPEGSIVRVIEIQGDVIIVEPVH